VFTALDLAQDNYAARLDQALTILQRRDDPEAYFSAAWSWRILGLCRLLAEADVQAFSDHLARAAQARLEFLGKVRGGLASDPEYVCASKNLPFTGALAAGGLTTAREIAVVSPTSHFPAVEYEDDFLYFHLLHRLSIAADDTVGHKAILARWLEVREGDESGALVACRGLVTRTPADFTAGFASFIAKRQQGLAEYRESPSFNEKLFAAEGQIYVEALALLRLAELRGLPTEPEYPLAPEIARVPVMEAPLARDAWRVLPA
jgi:hypothetical protein